jgi:hypothetical protein
MLWKRYPVLQGYTDADYAGDADSRKSTSGYLMTYAGGAVSWQSRLQKCVSLSTTDAEYIAAVEAAKEVLWMKNFLQELGMKQENYNLFCDSQSAIILPRIQVFTLEPSTLRCVTLDSRCCEFQVTET